MSQITNNASPIHALARTSLITTLTSLALLMVGCSSAPVLTDNRPAPARTSENSSTPEPAATADYHPKRNDLALFAMSLLNTPYSWGAEGPPQALTAQDWFRTFTGKWRACPSKAPRPTWAKNQGLLTVPAFNPAIWCSSTRWGRGIRM